MMGMGAGISRRGGSLRLFSGKYFVLPGSVFRLSGISRPGGCGGDGWMSVNKGIAVSEVYWIWNIKKTSWVIIHLLSLLS